MSVMDRQKYRRLRSWPVGWALIACVAAAIIGSNSLSHFADGVVHGTPAAHAAPPSFPVPVPAGAQAVCKDEGLLSGPGAAPAGAVVVPAGDHGSLHLSQPGATLWVAPGR